MACTEKQAEAIIQALYSTETLISILRAHKVDTQAFYKMIESVPLLTQNYIRAHSHRADLFAELVVEESRSLGDANQARNRMNALIWATSKMKPDKYGERIDVHLNQTIQIREALNEANSRIRSVLEIGSTGCEPAEKSADFTMELAKLLE